MKKYFSKRPQIKGLFLKLKPQNKKKFSFSQFVETISLLVPVLFLTMVSFIEVLIFLPIEVIFGRWLYKKQG